MKLFFRPIQCRSDSAPFAFRSTRRTATVTICVPAASCAAFITACDEYLPVPTASRDEKVRSAITRSFIEDFWSEDWIEPLGIRDLGIWKSTRRAAAHVISPREW